MKKYKFIVREVDAWLYDEQWSYNTVYNIGSFETCAKNEKKAFTDFLRKKAGITFKKNRTRIYFDGDNYVIEDRKTHEPLYDAILQNYC